MLELHFVPMVGTVGFGLAHHPEDYEDIYDEIDEVFADRGILPCSHRYCTIDVKADEPFVELLENEYDEKVVFFTAEELATVEVPNPSATVEKHVGTPSVCEAAAILGSNHGKLIIPKIKGKNWTAALAIDQRYLASDSHGLTRKNNEVRISPCKSDAHIEIVGAGPGDPDLVSVRGRKMLERADLILYAGSLVPKALTECHKPGAVVRSSADMTLEEQCALMKEHYDKGHFIVRLHTGDPCIFGAIQEQMAFFDANDMDYHITPGISSFLAAAAELQSQFTIPERCQTIILTRGEGRTPMPEKEQLHLLARSQSTMCIFLSAAIVDDVQRELLQEYPEDTPVAACYHLTWPDQKIYRGVLKDLARIVHDNHLTLTTMLVVGEAIDNRQGLSELYSKHFTHLFRQGN
jgi:precorrin-4 C11-methyltransferase